MKKRWAETSVTRYTDNPNRYKAGEPSQIVVAEYADATIRQLDHNHNFPSDIFELKAVTEPGKLDDDGDQVLAKYVRMIGGRTQLYSDGKLCITGFVEITRDGTPLDETEYLSSGIYRIEQWWQHVA